MDDMTDEAQYAHEAITNLCTQLQQAQERYGLALNACHIGLRLNDEYRERAEAAEGDAATQRALAETANEQLKLLVCAYPGTKGDGNVRLVIAVEPDGDGFHAFCPQLPGLHVAGDTEQEALKNAGDAISVYMASVIKHGDPLPHSRSEARRFQAQARRGEGE